MNVRMFVSASDWPGPGTDSHLSDAHPMSMAMSTFLLSPLLSRAT
eukprot:CAMPEP_0179176140 /NCGR_PEP_ID=MMETSP0796-20121207/87062_1 /TAXON_ID=73915 /ORGANISM="Pyrodinium bahamense, Strain pbaha01" /LENGTH=44 /DNA_ID= /DNA_START= /DNA_END= /DNA_ORIENTATION=